VVTIYGTCNAISPDKRFVLYISTFRCTCVVNGYKIKLTSQKQTTIAPEILKITVQSQVLQEILKITVQSQVLQETYTYGLL
jgi:hypothetical protein